MSQVNEQREWTSQSDMTAVERNQDTADAARTFAAAENFGPAMVDTHTGPRKVKPVGVPVDSGIVALSTPFHPSPTLNPQHFDREDFAEWQEDLGPARACLDTAFKGLAAIYDARVKLRDDPTITPAAASVKLAAQAERKHQQIYESFPRVVERLEKTVETLQKSLKAPVETQAGLGTVVDAIRAHSKGLSVDNRRQFIEDAFVNKDEKTLVALMGAPHYLSGLSRGMHDHYLQRLNEMREPSTVRRIKALRDAVTLMQRAYPIAITSVEKALGASFRGVKKLKAISEESEAALKRIMTPPGE